MLAFTFAKCCIGALVTGAAIAVPILINKGSAGGAVAQTSLNNQTTSQANSQATRAVNQVEREVTSLEQLKKDEAFETCLKENLKFRVNGEDGGTKWVSDGEYSPSVHGIAQEAQYQPNTCSREVSKK